MFLQTISILLSKIFISPIFSAISNEIPLNLLSNSLWAVNKFNCLCFSNMSSVILAISKFIEFNSICFKIIAFIMLESGSSMAWALGKVKILEK